MIGFARDDVTFVLGLLSKLAGTYLALERILVGMHPFVLLQHRFRAQTLAALLALVFGVYLVVVLEPENRLELLAAFVALEHVAGADVLLELQQLFEVLATHAAQVGVAFFGRVEADVVVEELFGVKHLAAVVAAEGQCVFAVGDRIEEHFFGLGRGARRGGGGHCIGSVCGIGLTPVAEYVAGAVRLEGDLVDDGAAFGAHHRLDVGKRAAGLWVLGHQNGDEIAGIVDGHAVVHRLYFDDRLADRNTLLFETAGHRVG